MNATIAPLRIAIVYGGDSAEREVSLESGAAVARALQARGQTVTLIDPRDQPLADISWREFDIAFLALHGTWGEDGQVQRELDELGVTYTGASAAASALAFDKQAAKERFRDAGVPTPAWAVIGAESLEDPQETHAVAARLGYPLVVKPNAQGSSVGVAILEDAQGLESAIVEGLRYDCRLLLETAIPGAEWTVGIVCGETLAPIRIRSAREFYDYQAKYHDDRTEYEIAREQEALSELRALSHRACEALGIHALGRVDIRVDNAGRPWVLEVNTIPGFTDHSLLPKAAAHAGLDLGALCERIIAAAVSQSQRSQRRAESG